MKNISLLLLLTLTFIINYHGETYCNILNNESNSKSNIVIDSQVNNHIDIDKIWTVDCRPEPCEVYLFWIGPVTNSGVECRIQKWEYKNNGEMVRFYTIVTSLQPDTQNIYSFTDSEIEEGMYYRYKVWMKHNGNHFISPEVFTVPQPSIGDWGDWPPNPALLDKVYVNGENDTVAVNSVEFCYPFNWCADSIKFRMIINSDTVDSGWRSKDKEYYVFNPKTKLDGVNDKDTCHYFIRLKDCLGNISCWSESRMAVLDTFPPAEVGSLEVVPKINDKDSICWVEINWDEAYDNLSGLKSYSIYRKIASELDGKFYTIKTNLPDTCHFHKDTLDEVDGGTIIYYKIGSSDNVGNKREGAEIRKIDSTLCLCSPSIEILADTITTNNKKFVKTECAKISFSDCNLKYLVGFDVKLNGQTDTTIKNNNNPFEVKLDRDTLFSIRVKAIFIFLSDTLKSLWSNKDIIYREYSPPACVRELKVSSDSTQWGGDDFLHWEGNIYLKWEQPSNDAVSYQIFRKKSGETEFEQDGEKDSDEKTITWVDKWSDENKLLAFDYYSYKIKGLNIFKKSHEFCNGCGIDSTYCKRAPIITEVKSISGSGIIKIKWEPMPTDPIKYPIDSIRFEIRYFRDNEAEPSRKFVADGDTIRYVSLDRSHRYCFEVRGIVVADNGDSLKTAWSLPECIEPIVIIPPVNNVELQSQPTKSDSPKIFVCWESYWENEEWNKPNLDKLMVDSFVVNRFTEIDILDTTTYIFRQPCPEWISACFMDTLNLEVGFKYIYEVIPFQTTEFGAGSPDDNIPAVIVSEIGRVYIPEIDTSDDTLYFYNPDSNKIYFDGRDGSLKVKWCCEDDNLEGADSVFVQISDNPHFHDHNFYFVRCCTVVTSNDAWHDREVVFQSISESPWYVEARDPVFLRVTAKDKWGNEHPYWSTDWDSLVSVINDTASPDPTTLKFFCVRADTSPDPGIVISTLKWHPPALDLESGLKYYNIARKNLVTSKDTIDLSLSDTTNISYIIDLSNLETSTDFLYHIITEDWVGHQTDGKGDIIWKALTTPKNFKVEYDSTDYNTVFVSCSPVEGANGYYIEWYSELDSLGKDFLRKDSLFHHISYTCQDTIYRWYHLIKSHFHTLAFKGEEFKGCCNESGWTPVKKPVRFSRHEIAKKSYYSNIGINPTLPDDYLFNQNHPNPFNTETIINFELPENAHVKIKIFNTMGMAVITLYDNVREAGYHSIIWNGKNASGKPVASGIYLIIFKANNFSQVRKCILLR